MRSEFEDASVVVLGDGVASGRPGRTHAYFTAREGVPIVLWHLVRRGNSPQGLSTISCPGGMLGRLNRSTAG